MRWWECVDSCKKPFNSKSAFEDHIRDTHQNLFIENQFPALVNMQERQMKRETQIECPLCKEMVPPSSHLRRHLGKHQKQLALFALPSNLEQTEEENQSDIADNGPASKEDLASDTSRAGSEQDISAEMNLVGTNRGSDLEAAPVASVPATSPEPPAPATPPEPPAPGVDDYDYEEQPILRSRDDRILYFIPNDGIDYSVIRTEIQPFLGPEASLTRGKHPKLRFQGVFAASH
jgi:Zinc finger, C2H2 type